MKKLRNSLKLCIISAVVMTMCLFMYKAVFGNYVTAVETNSLSDEEIKVLEEFLITEGYFDGTPTGKISISLTESAKQYCKNNNIDFPDAITYELIKQITEK